MDPLLWGPELWKMIHALAWRTDQGAVKEKTFLLIISLLPSLLPCGTCRANSRQELSANIPRAPFFDWSVSFHNSVKKTEYSVDIAKYREALRETKPFSEEECIRIFLYMAATALPNSPLKTWARAWNSVFENWKAYENFRLVEFNETKNIFAYYNVPLLKQRIYDIING